MSDAEARPNASRDYPANGDVTLDTKLAYAAMYTFLEAFWIRCGQPDDSLTKLLSFTQQQTWSDGGLADPAMWSDWLDAIAHVRART